MNTCMPVIHVHSVRTKKTTQSEIIAPRNREEHSAETHSEVFPFVAMLPLLRADLLHGPQLLNTDT